MPYVATTCDETISYRTSRFHTYNQTTTWVAIEESAINHTMQATYNLEQDDYIKLAQTLNTFDDDRYYMYVPEYYLAQRCTYANNNINVVTPIWSYPAGSLALLFTGANAVAFPVTTSASAGNITTLPLGHGATIVGQGTGLVMPLRLAAVTGQTEFSTDLKVTSGTVNYEFAQPRDYTAAAVNFTTADFPTPRRVMQRRIALPDTTFADRRVRGRRGVSATKDNSFSAEFHETIDNPRTDYIIKNVLSKALLATELIDLLDDENTLFPALLDSDDITFRYSGYTYTATVPYSLRTLRASA